MLNKIQKIYSMLTRNEKKSIIWLFIVMNISAVVQVIGIISIKPFATVAANPDIVNQNAQLLQLRNFLGIENNHHFIIALGLGVLLGILLTNVFFAINTWMTMHFVVTTTHSMSLSLLNNYTNGDYISYLGRNSSVLLNNITNETYRVVNGALLNILSIVSKTISTLFIFIFLLLLDPIASLVVISTISIGYLIVYQFIRKKVSRVGKRSAFLFEKKLRLATEVLGGMKDLLVLGRVQNYVARFRTVTQEVVKYQIFNRASAELPRFILETVAFCGILLVIIGVIAFRDNQQDILPLMAVYALAGYRLMPALQALYRSTIMLQHEIHAVDQIYQDLQHNRIDLNTTISRNKPTKMLFKSGITFKNVKFSYPTSKMPVLNNLTFDIKANKCVAFVGKSGSGKSTVIDIILGLLKPGKGQILIDSVPLCDENRTSWQAIIGYVPQVIFLADTSIKENIAFGISSQEINEQAVIKAAQLANIHNFISNELAEGYNTVVGERGIRLSGGQRQRIGVARALYHDPDILILDEATSALDSPTEQAMMEAVHNLAHDKTIILIAHRITTVKECDAIFCLEHGKITASGSYTELLVSSQAFRELASSTSGKSKKLV